MPKERKRHAVELTDSAWDGLAMIAISEGIIYNGRPSRNAVIEKLVDGEFSGGAGVGDELPAYAPPIPGAGIVSFEDAVAALSKYHRNAIYDGAPHQAKVLRHFYDLVVGSK